MPKASRALSNIDIAKIWARRVINTKTPAAVAAFQSTTLEKQTYEKGKIEELIKLIPDGSLPQNVMEITNRQKISPLYLPEDWLTITLSQEKYDLSSCIANLMTSRNLHHALIRKVAEFLRQQQSVSSIQARLANVVANQSVQNYVPHIKNVLSPSEHPPKAEFGEVGSFVSVVRFGDALEDVTSTMSSQIWYDFCSYVVDNKSSMETFSLGIRKEDLEWMESINKRYRLDKIVSANQDGDINNGQHIHKRPAM